MCATIQSLTPFQTARFNHETLDCGSGFVREMTATLALAHMDWTFQF